MLRKIFGRPDEEPGDGRLELISVHVPKNAGSSFRRVLETAYPEEGALQTIYAKEDGVETIWDGGVPRIDPRARAIHGHFPATPALRSAFPNAKMIAWVREPVARTISYYYFWKRTAPHGNPAHDLFLQLDLSLVEFARHPEMRREMLHYFERVELSDFFFIGLMERFDTDVRELAQLLGWPEPDIPKENISRERPRVSDDELHEIEHALGEAIELYNRVKAMRGLVD